MRAQRRWMLLWLWASSQCSPQVLTQMPAILGRFPHLMWFAGLVALSRSGFQVTFPDFSCAHTNFPWHPSAQSCTDASLILNEPFSAPVPSSFFPLKLLLWPLCAINVQVNEELPYPPVATQHLPREMSIRLLCHHLP